MIMRVLALGATGFLELVRSRVYLNLLVAGIGLVLAALAFDRLSAGEGARVLTDMGLAFSSLVSAALAGTMAIVTVTREIETKQVHLLVARPILRAEFVLGRFVTTALLVLLSNGVLGLVLGGLAGALGGHPERVLFASLFVSFEGFIVAAIAVFFGVGSSSTMSAVFTTTLFVLGRLTLALKALLDRGALEGVFEPVFRGAYLVLPHLGCFDLTSWAHGDAAPGAVTVLQAALYGAAYTAALLAFATFRFERRDLL